MPSLRPERIPCVRIGTGHKRCFRRQNERTGFFPGRNVANLVCPVESRDVVEVAEAEIELLDLRVREKLWLPDWRTRKFRLQPELIRQHGKDWKETD